jgi:hypothetical protein
MKRAVWSVAFVVLCATSIMAQPPAHVRVIQDTSLSMSGTGSRPGNDPGRLAILATELFYDLVRPSLGVDGTFRVIPFPRSNPWTNKSSPPSGTGTPVEPGPPGRQREEFMARMDRLPYDSAQTFFYPGLSQAIRELDGAPGGDDARRVIVLVTDGLPDDRDEMRFIQQDLLPRLQSSTRRIQLYILAFGPVLYAPNNPKQFFDDLAGSDNVFTDQNGSELPQHMIEIFGRSFGYVADVAGGSTLDLARGATLERAAVVALWRPHFSGTPDFRLSGPSVGRAGLNNPNGLVHADVPAATYALRWILRPPAGTLNFTSTGTAPTKIAVLRPVEIALSVKPGRPGARADQAMALSQMDLKVVVKPVGGGAGEPPPVNISFTVFGPRVKDTSGTERYAWEDKDFGPANSGVSPGVFVRGEGTLYDIKPRFTKEPEAASYTGYIEILAKSGDAVVASLRWPDAHSVEVYPSIQIAAFKSEDDALKDGRSQTLGRFDQGCAEFDFKLIKGRLPDLFSVRASLPSSLIFDGPLAGANITADAATVQNYPLPAGQRPQVWSNGRGFTPQTLLATHKVCVEIARQTAAKPDVRIPINFTLMKAPYDGFPVIQTFTLKASVAQPGLERWLSALTIALAIATILILLWYLRFVAAFPDDFRAVVGADSGLPALKVARMGEGSIWGRVLRLRLDRPLFASGGNRRIGWVRPIEEDLYRFKPDRSISKIEEHAAGEWRPLNRDSEGCVDVRARRLYRCTLSGANQLFRLEFEP